MSLKNDAEDAMIAALDDKELAALFLPAIKEIIKSGGGAEAILKRSEGMAAFKLATSMQSAKEDVALKAALSILDRTQGRPVERHLNIYADVAKMSEDQLEQEIKTLAKRAGVNEIAGFLAPKKDGPLLPSREKKPIYRRRKKLEIFDPNNNNDS
jgi:hypothetical protein